VRESYLLLEYAFERPFHEWLIAHLAIEPSEIVAIDEFRFDAVEQWHLEQLLEAW